MDKEIGRMKTKHYSSDLVLQEEQENDKRIINIGEYVVSENFTGFTRRCISIPEKKWPEFLEMVKKVKISKT